MRNMPNMATGPQAMVLQLLAGIPLFRHLDQAECFEIVRILKPITHPAGTLLFQEGDPADSLIIIERGSVDISLASVSGDVIIATIGANEVLGELCLIDRGERSATATVTQSLHGYAIHVRDFDRLRNELHPAAYKLVRELSRVMYARIRAVDERLESILGYTKESSTALKETEKTQSGNTNPASPGILRSLAGKLWGRADTAPR